MKGLGYKEILAYLEGECSLDEAVYILKRDTRHFAKRQLTWFKRERDVIWINKDDFDHDEDRILDHMLKMTFFANRENSIRESTALGLYGGELSGSITRLEQYAVCAFSHFLKYGLKLSERDEYGFMANDFGITVCNRGTHIGQNIVIFK